MSWKNKKLRAKIKVAGKNKIAGTIEMAATHKRRRSEEARRMLEVAENKMAGRNKAGLRALLFSSRFVCPSRFIFCPGRLARALAPATHLQ